MEGCTVAPQALPWPPSCVLPHTALTPRRRVLRHAARAVDRSTMILQWRGRGMGAIWGIDVHPEMQVRLGSECVLTTVTAGSVMA